MSASRSFTTLPSSESGPRQPNSEDFRFRPRTRRGILLQTGSAAWSALRCGPPAGQAHGTADGKGGAMRRREFITLLGGAAAAWPLAGMAQQANMPLVGFLNSASPDTYRFNADSFREGLAKAGFVEGRNLRIEERWARGDYEALPALAAELVAKGVVAIAATGDVASARAAKRCEQHGAGGLHDWRRPGPLWTDPKHKSPRRARDRHPVQPECPRRKASRAPPGNCPERFSRCAADESHQSQCQH